MNLKEESKYEKGISAIIPSYKGENYISNLLNSLKKQTIDYNLFEVIFIINGELDNTPQIIEKFIEDNPKINVILEYSEKGVCNARNLGIEVANREYTIFIDDDDFISNNYFEKLYEKAAPNRIVIGTFFDVNQDTEEVEESYITPPLLKYSGIIKNPYKTIKDILVITTDKLIPTDSVKENKFNPYLNNGVDISYYSQFYVKYDFEFYIIDKKEEAIYYRLWRDNSISRKPLSYEFNVKDRLKVINDINKSLKNVKTKEMEVFIKNLTAGQVVKINEYLKKYPEDLKKVSMEINKYHFKFFPYKYFNEDLTKLDKENSELIISYSFPPSMTTTGNVMAKRILTNKRNVDIIHGNFKEEEKDYELEELVNQFIINKFLVDVPFSIDWNIIKEFVNKGMEKLKNVPKYEKIYSRSYFQHSHFLALKYKLKNPETCWIAEFSDPTIYNFEGNENSTPINNTEDINKFNEILPNYLPKIKESDSLNFICEYLTFIFADKIIFTNENQKEVMIDVFPYDEIKKIINKKYKIIQHPILDEKYYYIKENNYKLDNSKVNFGYFGIIFGKRTIEDFINGFDNIEDKFKNKLNLHIFTPSITLFEQILSSDLSKNTIINSKIGYLDFLNLCTKLDVLVVEDTHIKDRFISNPYLPSKLSDYLGSKTDIWGICEKNSVMDNIDLKYKSRLGDYYSTKNTLNKIISNKLNIKYEDLCGIDFLNISSKLFKKEYETNLDEIVKHSEYLDVLLKEDKNTIEYLRNRSIHFTQKISELIQVAKKEFEKNKEYENKIKELEIENQKLLKENREIKSSNSWKLTKNFRKIGKKFK